MTTQDRSAVRATSLHSLNADKGLSKMQRVFWMLLNQLNNSFSNTNVDGKILKSTFRVPEDELERLWGEISLSVSPARRLCDLYWKRLPWRALTKEIPRIRALEIGCGTGVYGRMLKSILGDSFEHYVGVDINPHEEWEVDARANGHCYRIGNATDIEEYLPGANLILTQSALEHFEQDLVYFRQVANYVREQKNPIFQVHLVPSAGCISTFPWHGVRQYTARTVSKITRLFGSETSAHLVQLGGAECNRIHRKFITIPNWTRRVDLRHVENQQYDEQLRSAMSMDFNNAGKGAAFYALLMLSNFDFDPFAPTDKSN